MLNGDGPDPGPYGKRHGAQFRAGSVGAARAAPTGALPQLWGAGTLASRLSVDEALQDLPAAAYQHAVRPVATDGMYCGVCSVPGHTPARMLSSECLFASSRNHHRTSEGRCNRANSCGVGWGETARPPTTGDRAGDAAAAETGELLLQSGSPSRSDNCITSERERSSAIGRSGAGGDREAGECKR